MKQLERIEELKAQEDRSTLSQFIRDYKKLQQTILPSVGSIQMKKSSLKQSKLVNQNIKPFTPPISKFTPLELQKQHYQQKLLDISEILKTHQQEDLKHFQFATKIQQNIEKSSKLMGKLDTYIFCGYIQKRE